MIKSAKILKTNNLTETSLRIRNICLHQNFRTAEIKNFRILLTLQILTLIAATIGAFTYFLKHTEQHRGEVKGILYTGVNSSAMIDNQVLEEGDTIYGITIVKIYPKKVEFAKNGKIWSQKICEYPNPEWTNTKQ